MQIEQLTYSTPGGWPDTAALRDAQLVLVFGERSAMTSPDLVRGLADRWPVAEILGCSTAGQIQGTDVSDAGAVATAVRFDHTTVAVAMTPVTAAESAASGAALAVALAKPGLVHVLVLSEGLVLFELDGQSALALYKRYLGDHAADLPASGLLFPLSLRTRDVSAPVVRTILAVNEADQSLTFAGNVPTGGYVRLMKANFDRLIDGAVDAGRISAEALGGPVDLALLISCVGRRMVLRQRVEEEIEGVRDIVGSKSAITVTTFSER